MPVLRQRRRAQLETAIRLLGRDGLAAWVFNKGWARYRCDLCREQEHWALLLLKEDGIALWCRSCHYARNKACPARAFQLGFEPPGWCAYMVPADELIALTNAAIGSRCPEDARKRLARDLPEFRLT